MTKYLIMRLKGFMELDPEFYTDGFVEADNAKKAIQKAIKEKEGEDAQLRKAEASEEQDYLAIPQNNWNTYHRTDKDVV